MYSLGFKSVPQALPQPFFALDSAFSLLPFLRLSLLPTPSSSRDQVQLSARLPPSRVTGVPTASVLLQEKPNVLNVGFIICGCISIIVLSGVISWTRSPHPHGRLNKGAPPPPPPTPPPPPHQAPAPADPDPDDDEASPEGGGDGGDPQQDGAVDNQDARNADGLAIGQAPAPEDPPPPVGAVEEDDEGDSYGVFDGPLIWFLVLILGKFALRLFKRQHGAGSANPKPVNAQLETISKAASSTIPGLFERVASADSPLETCPVPPPPSVIAGLLQRLSPATSSRRALQQDFHQSLPTPLATTPAPVTPQSRLLSLRAWKTYVLLVGTSALVILGGIAHLLLALPRVIVIRETAAEAPLPKQKEEHILQSPPEQVQEQELAPPPPEEEDKAPALSPLPNPIQEEDVPPTSPDPRQATREMIRLSLLRHKEYTVDELDIRAQGVQLLQRAAARRIAEPEPASEEDAHRERVRRVREIQRRVWTLMCEAALGGDEEEDEEGEL